MKIFKMVVIILIFSILPSTSHAFLPWERNSKFLDGIDKLNNGQIDEAIKIFNELKTDGFQNETPFLLFELGSAYKKRGKNNDLSSLNQALELFNEYQNIVKNDPVQYRNAVINIAYTYSNLNKFSQGVTVIENYLINIKNPTGTNDGEAELCQANLYNGWGFELFKSEKYKNSIKKFEKAFEIKKLPLFANNLINAYIADEASDKNCIKIKKVHDEIIKDNRWSSDPRFRKTDRLIKKLCPS